MIAKNKPKRSTTSEKEPCPCGSGISLADCCLMVMNDHQLAKTPEILMRSRYTAFVIENATYLLNTWAPATRPAKLDFAEKIRWLNLNVINSALSSKNEDEGWVEFETSLVTRHDLVKMQEKSYFIKKNNLWLYHSGDLQSNKHPLSLNGQCPCGSGNKFKRCCLP